MESLTPPPELRKQWIDESPGLALDGHTRVGTDWNAVMDRAAGWGSEHAMTTNRARAAKAALIEDIQALLNQFTADTGCARTPVPLAARHRSSCAAPLARRPATHDP